MSFSCPYFDFKDSSCMRLTRRCVPGRPGCVLRSNSVFAVPVERRLRDEDDRHSCSRPGDYESILAEHEELER